MYEPGDLTLEEAEDWEREEGIYDARNDITGVEGRRPFWKRYATLPHSCDGWVIGGPEQVREMIADLQTALAEMERKP